jgi:hypothetical protein
MILGNYKFCGFIKKSRFIFVMSMRTNAIV